VQKFLICDMDNTLTTFPSYIAMPRLEKYLEELLGPRKARKICRFMDQFNATVYKKAKGVPLSKEDRLWLGLTEKKFKFLLKDMIILGNPSELFWSRELWLRLASARVTPNIAVSATQKFWRVIAIKAREYDDSYGFLRWLRRDHPEWELVVVSSSDSHLYVKDGKFVYDPEYSDQGKRNRIPASLLDISGNNIFVGDPISKPRPEFWERVLTNICYNQGEDIAIMVGDSYASDIIGVSRYGITPVLIDRDNKTRPSDVPEAKYVIKNFCELQEVLRVR